MARERKAREEPGDPAWLVTFSDLMTLLLTFFVLLLSMAVIDERAKLVVLGSVSRVFGSADTLFNPLAPKENPKSNTRIEPGAMEGAQNDLAPLRDMLFDDASKDLNFQENKYVQIFSINDEVLFERGGFVLSEPGKEQLNRILPYLQRISYPLLVAGHTSTVRDESELDHRVSKRPGMDSTWPISYRRALAVYRHLVSMGIEPDRLSLESFGRFHPRYSNNTPEGRRKNRRVDLVLDKRNLDWIRKVEALREENKIDTQTEFKGFTFDLKLPDAPPGGRQGTRP